MKVIERPVFYNHFNVRAIVFCLFAILFFAGRPFCAGSQPQQTVWSEQEKPIFDTIKMLRSLLDDKRARTTKDLALQIRQLPAGMNKVRLANSLANLSNRGRLWS